MHVLPHTVQGAEVILESYAQVYYNQFTTGNSPFQLVQWSTVPNNKKNQKMETSLKTGFAQIFSCCPKNLRCPNFGGAAAPLAPPHPPWSVRLWEFIPANYFGVILSWLEVPNIPNCFLNTSKCCRKYPKMFWWFSEDFQTFSHDILQTLAQWPQHSRPQSINVSDSASKELASLPGRHA